MNDVMINIILSLILFITFFILISKNINMILIMSFSIFALTSAIFALMGIKFLAIIYLIIYIGAIAVVFIVAIKTTQQQKNNFFKFKKIPLIFLSLIFSFILFSLIIKTENTTDFYNYIDYKSFTDLLFNKNFVIIEIISLILVASIVGAINFLKKES